MATKRKPLTLDERKRQSIRRGLHKAQVVTTEELRARMLASLDAKLRKTTKAKKGSVAPVPVTIMPLPKHRLFVRFADGVQGIYDMTELLVRPVFRPLRDPRFFALVMLGETGCPCGRTRQTMPRARCIVCFAEPRTSGSSKGCEPRSSLACTSSQKARESHWKRWPRTRDSKRPRSSRLSMLAWLRLKLGYRAFLMML